MYGMQRGKIPGLDMAYAGCELSGHVAFGQVLRHFLRLVDSGGLLCFYEGPGYSRLFDFVLGATSYWKEKASRTGVREERSWSLSCYLVAMASFCELGTRGYGV
jgi:hypothetical protein